MMEITYKNRLSLFETMLTIRETETLILECFSKKLFSGTVHTCIGQEAVSAGVSLSLCSEDVVFSNHRGHGHMLAKGVLPKSLVYEMAGRDDGQCGGLGGSQHIAAPSVGFMGSNGITGGAVPIAVGYGYGLKFACKSNVSVVYFGDGAFSQGVVHEALNMASIWKLPVIFICENNMYGMSSPAKKFISGDIAERAFSYGMLTYKIDGMDVDKVFETATKARAHAVSSGPAFMECLTYRFEGHSKSDRQLYRTKEEINEWKERDPIVKYRRSIQEEDVLSITSKIDREMNDIRKGLGALDA